MCLEKKVTDLTVAIDALTTTVETLVQVNKQQARILTDLIGKDGSTSGTDKQEETTVEKPVVDHEEEDVKKDSTDSKQVAIERDSDSEPEKHTQKESMQMSVETPSDPDEDEEGSQEQQEEDDEPEVKSVHTHKELKDALNEYKEKYGIGMAKKLMPKMGYSHSSKVPLSKIDEVYDEVRSLIDEVDL